jgi:hypothetical protein
MIYQVNFQKTSQTFEIAGWKLKSPEWDAIETRELPLSFQTVSAAPKNSVPRS